jgi:uncharacterized protein YcbK (DUF882 family)
MIDPDQLTPNLHLDEFRCPCCHDVNRENALRLAQALQPVWDEYGVLNIWSGFRCPKQNAAQGGVLFSQHLTGLAADIAITGDRDRFELTRLLLKHGFRRLGMADRYIHADLGQDQVDVIWTYY